MLELQTVLNKIIRKLIEQKGERLTTIIMNWSHIIEQKYIKGVFPQTVKTIMVSNKVNYQLHIAVNNNALATILHSQQRQILKKITNVFGYQAINELKFTVRDIE